MTDEHVKQGTAPDALTAWRNQFAYDPVGNRLEQLRQTENGTPQPVVYTYDERDRLLTENGSSGPVTYGWDANGNQTAKSGADGATYTWDIENRLVRVDLADETIVRHAYDADGARVWTTRVPTGAAPETVEFLVDTSEVSQVVVESEAGQVLAFHTRGLDLLATLRADSGDMSNLAARYLHQEGLGSVRAITDHLELTDRYSQEAFGTPVEHVGVDENGFLFAGEQWENNSSLYYNRTRWLNPSLGSFTSKDTFAGLVSRPSSLASYSYVSSNPVLAGDPNGTFDIRVAAIMGAVLAGIVGAYFFSQRGVFLRAYDGIPLSIGTQPVVVSGSRWDEDEAAAVLAAASSMWLRMAKIRLVAKPAIVLDAPELLNITSYLPVDKLRPLGGHVTLFTRRIGGGCGASPNAEENFAVSAIADRFDPLSCIDDGRVLAHEIGHHLLGPGHGSDLPGGLMVTGGGTAKLSLGEAQRARQAARRKHFWMSNLR